MGPGTPIVLNGLSLKGPLSAMAENQWVAGVKNPILIGTISPPFITGRPTLEGQVIALISS